MRFFVICAALFASTVQTVVLAAEIPCSEVYQKAHLQYLDEIRGLRHLEGTLNRASVGGGVGYATCLAVKKSILGCTVFIGPFVLGAQGYRAQLSNKISMLEDANDIFSVYQDFLQGKFDSEVAQKLFMDLGVQTSQEDRVVADFLRSMKTGQLCSEQRQPISRVALLHLLNEDRFSR